VQLLRQPQYSPYPVEEQIVSIWSGTTGKFDDVPVGDVLRFERDFLDYLRRESKVLDAIRESGLFGDDEAQAVTDALKAFKPTFQTSEGTLLGSEAPAEAMDEADVDQEQIVKQKRG